MSHSHEPDSEHGGFDLNEVELHTDVQVERAHAAPQPEESEAIRTTRPWAIWVSALLNVLLAVGFGLFYIKADRLQTELGEQVARSESASRNAYDTQEKLDSSNETIAQLRSENTELRREIDQRKATSRVLEGDLTDVQKQFLSMETRLDELGKERDGLKSKAARWQRDYNTLEKEFKSFKTASETERVTLQAELDQRESELADLRPKVEQLRADASAARVELNRVKSQFDEEAKASLSMIQERSDLEQKNKRLAQELDQTQQLLEKANQRLQQLEGVQQGQLVPYSMELIPAQLTYREPYPVSVKMPRRFGPYVVRVLIDENGSVENSAFLPGQTVDPALARPILQNVMNWKFTPPNLDGVRVKTWQPVIIGQ